MKLLVTIQSLILALAVILSSAHAKDVLKFESQLLKPAVKTAFSDDAPVKITAELHPHVDKQTLKTFYGSDVQQHVSHRSLRFLEQGVSAFSLEFRVGMSLWWRLLTAKLLV